MKLLFLIDTLEVGGAETSMLEIARGFKKWTPVIVHIYPGETLKPQFENAGFKVYSLNIHAKFGIKEASRKLSIIIEKEKPNLIHATLFKAEMISRIIGPRFKIPVINSFVNDSYSKERYNSLKLKQILYLKLYQIVDKLTSKKVTKFMSITHSIIPNYARVLNIDPQHVRVIYRGRNIQELYSKVDHSQIAALKQLYGEGPIILTVSRLLTRKGYCESIAAMKKVIELYPSTRYLIAGEGHDRSLFEELIKSFGLKENIILLGNRRDVPSLLAFSDIFLFPSHYEGQGGAMVEAMILGKPIISSKIPVIEESVVNKHSALLFEPKNIEDMTSKILWAIANPVQMKIYGANAKMDAEERFDIRKVSRMHEEMYTELVCNNYLSSEKRHAEKIEL